MLCVRVPADAREDAGFEHIWVITRKISATAEFFTKRSCKITPVWSRDSEHWAGMGMPAYGIRPGFRACRFAFVMDCP